jgi:hypothetical protein
MNLIGLPWILGSLLANSSISADDLLPWPSKSMAIMLAAPMLPLCHLSVALASIPILEMNFWLYFVPMQV